MMKLATSCLLALSLSARTALEARAQLSSVEPTAVAQGTAQIVLNPQATVKENGSALLQLKVGNSPHELLFEQVEYAPSGTPQSETDFRFGTGGKTSGRIVTRLDASGRLLAQEFYDGAGKLLERSRGVVVRDKMFVVQPWPLAPVVPRTKFPRLTQIGEDGAALATYSYDQAGHLTKSVHPLLPQSEGATVEYLCDLNGRPTRKVLRLAHGITATTLYDAGGKRSEQQIFKPGKGTLKVSYLYNPRGQLSRTSMRDADSGTQDVGRADYLYDKAGRFEAEEVRENGVLAMRAVFTRDAAGKVQGTTTHKYQDGKLAGTMTMRSPDDKTLEITQLDAAGKLLERQTFTTPKKGEPNLLLRHEEVAPDGSKLVTIYDAQGQQSGESWFKPDGSPDPDHSKTGTMIMTR